MKAFPCDRNVARIIIAPKLNDICEYLWMGIFVNEVATGPMIFCIQR